MKLEEAINQLKRRSKVLKLEYAITNEDIKAIEIALNYIDNSISKEVIEDKIKEIDQEFDKKNTGDNNEWYIDSNICEYAKEKLQELLEGK